MKQIVDFIWVTLTHPIYSFRLFLKECRLYRHFPKLAVIDFALWRYYYIFFPFFRHTYQKIKTKKHVQELVYGETPYSSFEIALQNIPISEQTVFYDLGCGQGKLAFYMAIRHGVSSYGIDIIPTFIKTASTLAKKYRVPYVHFQEQDIFSTDISEATVVYLTWTCFFKETKTRIISKLAEELSSNAFVITTSEPILHPAFILKNKHFIHFSWGKGWLFVHQLQKL